MGMADKYLMWSDEVETELRAYADRKHACGQTELANGILKAVNHLQTITKARDAVAVVRCKECKYSGMYCFGDGSNGEQLACLTIEDDGFVRFATRVDPNHFCAYGERKKNG